MHSFFLYEEGLDFNFLADESRQVGKFFPSLVVDGLSGSRGLFFRFFSVFVYGRKHLIFGPAIFINVDFVVVLISGV